MGRLTEESNWCFLSCSVGTSVREDCPMYANCMTRLMYDKLKHYEDLEEQGRLIELPCAVGDTVYWISEPDACLFCVGACYERCEEGALKIKEIPFKPHMLNEIGEIIFLTKEEAERKLKELEGVKE